MVLGTFIWSHGAAADEVVVEERLVDVALVTRPEPVEPVFQHRPLLVAAAAHAAPTVLGQQVGPVSENMEEISITIRKEELF